MPVTADNSPNIQWPLPEGKPAFLVKDIFSKEMLDQIKGILAETANWGPESDPNRPNQAKYHTISGRWSVEPAIPDNITQYLEKTAKKNWENESLKIKGVWFARYQKYDGVTPYLWEHMDQPGTQYTMDICIESPGVSWGVTVDGETFEESENCALFFMGQQQAHSRPPYPTDSEEAYVVVMFALFVDQSHWMYDMDIYDEDQYEAWEEPLLKYKLDGDIRYYEYTGHAPRFDGLPDGNYVCSAGRCSQCEVVDEDFISKIEGYVHVK